MVQRCVLEEVKSVDIGVSIEQRADIFEGASHRCTKDSIIELLLMASLLPLLLLLLLLIMIHSYRFVAQSKAKVRWKTECID